VADGVVMFGAVTLEEQFRRVPVLGSVVGGRIGTGIFVDPRQRHHQPEFDEHRVQRRRCSQRALVLLSTVILSQVFSKTAYYFFFFPQVFASLQRFCKNGLLQLFGKGKMHISYYWF
jgi:hypothetical protein